MTANVSSDWAVLLITVAFISLIIYVTIHGRLQQKKSEEEKNQKSKKR